MGHLIYCCTCNIFAICIDNFFYVLEGTDKDAIIGLLTTRSKAQRHSISESYQKQESNVSQCFHIKIWMYIHDLYAMLLSCAVCSSVLLTYFK